MPDYKKILKEGWHPEKDLSMSDIKDKVKGKTVCFLMPSSPQGLTS